MGCSSCGSDHVSASGRCDVCGAVDGSSLTVLSTDAPTTLAVPSSEIPTGFTPLPPGSTPAAGTSRASLAAGPLPAGQARGRRYHIIRMLGAGGMGVVYQAWDAELGVAVALKVIRPEVLLDPGSAGEVERRFKRELVLARQVTHKHVVRLHHPGA